jgi:hypothetical protein
MAQGKRSISQRLWFRALGLAAIALVLSPALAAQGDLAAIQQKLQQRITLATLDSNGEITAAGSVVTLQKGELQMCATTAPAGAGAPANTYKNGKLSAGMFSWNLGLGLLNIQPNTIPMHTSVAGEKFWIVHYNVMKNHVEFKIWTDPDSNNIRYWAWLVIPFEKKQIPSPDEFMNTLAEVLAVAPAGDQGAQPAQGGQLAAFAGEYLLEQTGSRYTLLPNGSSTILNPGGSTLQCLSKLDGDWIRVLAKIGSRSMPVVWNIKIQGDKLYLNGTAELVRQGGSPASAPDAAQAAAPAPAPMQEIAPPPPPSDAPAPMPAIAPPPPPPAAAAVPPTISLGQTMNQVTAAFGEPLKVANLGGKSIFYYKDMKVTFINGKVSNVE